MSGRSVFQILVVVFILSVYMQAQTPAAEKLTNRQVISLHRAGLTEDLIVRKILSSEPNFDFSTEALIELKRGGVGDKIVFAMLRVQAEKEVDVASPGSATARPDNLPPDPAYGIYLSARSSGTGSMIRLLPSVSVQNRVGGHFTRAIIPLGFGKIKTKANLPGKRADLQITDPRPVFYFYLDAASGGLNSRSGIPASPKEIVLVRFHIRKDEREIAIAKENSYAGKGGLSDEYVIDFEFEALGGGKYRVFPKKPLAAGEYAFFLVSSGQSNISPGIGLKFFDFGIRGKN